MPDVVFVDRGHCDGDISRIAVAEGDLIPRRDAERTRGLFAEDRALVRQCDRLFADARAESEEVLHPVHALRHAERERLNAARTLRLDRFLTDHEGRASVPLRDVRDKLFALLVGERLDDGDRRLVVGDLGELKVGNDHDGVMQAESHKDEAHASRNADDGHEKALFISEHVAHGGLLRKAEPLPQERDALHEHAFARLRRLGAHDLRGTLARNAETGKESRKPRAQHACGDRDPALQKIVRQNERMQAGIQQGVCVHDDEREELFADQNAEHRTRERGQERVTQIAQENESVAAAERLERSDLLALLLHHSRHCRQADERRDKKEDDGKKLPEARDALGVVFKIDVRLYGVSPQNVPLRRGHERFHPGRDDAAELRGKRVQKFVITPLAGGVGKPLDLFERLVCELVVFGAETVQLLRTRKLDADLGVIAEIERLGSQEHEAVDLAVPDRARAAHQVHVLRKVRKPRNGELRRREPGKRTPVVRRKGDGVADLVIVHLGQKHVDEALPSF